MWFVIDEASRFLSNAMRFRADLGPPILIDASQTIRKRGIFLMLATQSISELPAAASANFATKVIFKTNDGANLRYLSDLLSLNPDQKAYLSALPERQALLSFPFWPSAFVIEIPERTWAKADVKETRKAMEPVLKGLSWVPVDSETERVGVAEKSSAERKPQETNPPEPATERTAQGSGNGSMLAHSDVDYLISIARDPFLGATARDKKNGIPFGTGTTMRKKLVNARYLILHKVKPPYRSHETILTEITEKGWQELQRMKAGVHKPAGRGGFMHTFWQAAIRDWLDRHQPSSNPRIEAEVNGKAIDVLADINSQAEAFEVVMNGGEWASQMKEIKNIVKDLEVAGVAVVNICAEDQQTLARIREHVQRECGDETGKHLGKVQWRSLGEFWEK